MGLKLCRLVLVVALGGAFTTARAAKFTTDEIKQFTIAKRTVREIFPTSRNKNNQKPLLSMDQISEVTDSVTGQVNPVEQAGKVISIARDLVAFGEDVYKLVIKGKPSNVTNYAPISVVPKIGNQAVDILETEGWSYPVKRSFEVVYENLFKVEVVKFSYSVIYSYKGTYNGKGAYLTSVQIIPESVATMFGFDFTATMKLGGIQNQGTREDPIAGANLLMEYTVGSVVITHHVTDNFFVAGDGSFRKY